MLSAAGARGWANARRRGRERARRIEGGRRRTLRKWVVTSRCRWQMNARQLNEEPALSTQELVAEAGPPPNPISRWALLAAGVFGVGLGALSGDQRP